MSINTNKNKQQGRLNLYQGLSICHICRTENDLQRVKDRTLSDIIGKHYRCVCITDQDNIHNVSLNLEKVIAEKREQQNEYIPDPVIYPFDTDLDDLIKFLHKQQQLSLGDKISQGVFLLDDMKWAEGKSINQIMAYCSLLNSLTINCVVAIYSRQFSATTIEMIMSYFRFIDNDGLITQNKIYMQLSGPIIQDLDRFQREMHISYLNLPIIKTTLAGAIIACNDCFVELTGYTREELLSKNLLDIACGKKMEYYTGKMDNRINNLWCGPFQSQYIISNGDIITTEEILCSYYEEGELYHCYLINNEDSEKLNMNYTFRESNSVIPYFFRALYGSIAVFQCEQNSIDNFTLIACDDTFKEIIAAPGYVFDFCIDKIKVLLKPILQNIINDDRVAFIKIPDIMPHRNIEIMLFSPFSQHVLLIAYDTRPYNNFLKTVDNKLTFFQNILDGIPTPAFLRDTKGRFQFCNKAFQLALGLSREEILGKSLYKVLPEDLASKYRAMDLSLLINPGIQTYEWEFQHADGKRHDVIFNKAPLSDLNDRFIGVVGTFIDITELKKTQEALRKSDERFRSVFCQSPIGIAIYAPSGKITNINAALLEILGVEGIDDVEHFNLFADRHFCKADVNLLKEINILSYEDEIDFDKDIFRTKKSGKAYIEYNICPLMSSKHEIEGYLVQVQDVTEQRKAQQALATSEANLRRLNDNMIDIISQINLEGKYEYVSPSCRLLGYKPEEMLENAFYDYIHPQDLSNVEKELSYAMKNYTFANFEYRCLCADKSYIYMETVANMLLEQGSICGAVLVSRDVTERKKIESELSRLDRLSTVGEMAAGLGHEIRNPMTTVRGFLQIIANEKDLLPYKEIFNLMIEELDHANGIITEFLSLAKDKPLDKNKENLNDILMAVSPLISVDAIKSDKQIVMELSNIPDLMLDSKEIRQLVVNMVRNGLDAMVAGCTLTIKTYIAGNNVVLHIEDQGCGIKEEIIEDIGKPFFTTKDQGVGLGLPICYNIAQRHKAIIDIATANTGTIFRIRFPINKSLGLTIKGE